MIWIFRILCRHRRCILTGIHNIGHIEHILRCQPVIQNQQLLILRLCTGILDNLHCFIALVAHDVAVVLHAQLVAVHKGHNGAGQVIIAVIAVSDSINRNASQNQHLAQNAEAVLALVIVLHVERQLRAKDICICLPVVLILLEHVQYRLLLLCSQLLFGFGSVCLGRLDPNVFQFLLYGLDCWIRCINGCLCITRTICNHRCIDIRLIQTEWNLFVSHGNRAARRDLLLGSRFCRLCACVSGLRCGGGLVCRLLWSCVCRKCRHAHKQRQEQTQDSFELLIHNLFSIFVQKCEHTLLSVYIHFPCMSWSISSKKRK